MSVERIDLDGKVGVVTGASSGIGEAAARRLAEEGMDVALGARRVDRLEETARDIEDAHGVEAVAVDLDVRSWIGVQAFAREVEDALGGCDLLFANAGTGGRGRVEDLDVETWHDVLDTNLTGVFYTCKALLPLMRDRPGWRTIVATASVSGTMGMAGSSAYCASKWGLRGFIQSLALEAAEEEIRCATVNPGYVNTRWHRDHPEGREMIQPEDVADLVVYLATMPDTAMVDDVTLWPARMYTA